MTVKELKQKLNEFPNDYPIVLLDITTDDSSSSLYELKNDNLEIINLYEQSNESKPITGIAITFENNHNENPI
jgi:hypothetical protein